MKIISLIVANVTVFSISAPISKLEVCKIKLKLLYSTDLDKVALISAIRPDHFINKTFIAENIKITEFYNKLKTKFNTDEEI